MRSNKEQSKQAVEVYSTFLYERALISEIQPKQVRGETHYTFSINDPNGEYTRECAGIKNLADMLESMQSAYCKARTDLGFDDRI